MSSRRGSAARPGPDKAETRRAMAGTAARLFAERGFEAVTMAEIAEAAGVPAESLDDVSLTKEQLFFTQEPLLRAGPADAVRGRSPGESLADAVRGVLFGPADPDALVVLARIYRDSPALRDHALARFAAHERDLRQAIENDRGSPAGAAPGILAAVLLAPVRETWECTLVRIAGGLPPEEALAQGGRELDDAFAMLAAALPAPGAGSAAKGRKRVRRSPSGASGRGEPLRGERPSITGVARLAGVSATTVSHTLNGRRPVAQETRRRVLEAIEQLGYRPNVLARGLRTSRSQTIGLVIPDITNPFYPALARGMQDVLGPAGYDEIISNTDGDRRRERAAIEQMIARQVDGLAFAVFHTHADDLVPAIEAGIPVVRLGGRLAQHGVDVVRSDDEGAAAEATRHLVERGYRRIAFISGPPAEGPAAERLAGYRAALAAAGARIDQRLVVHTDFDRAGGALGAAALLDLPDPPDAVLCANDVMAIGAIDTARQRGLRVPGGLAVMGFDDIEAASMMSPALTTMANPAREIGQACARRLLDRLSGGALEPYTEVVVPARLVPRRST